MEITCPHCTQKLELDAENLSGATHFACPACTGEVAMPRQPGTIAKPLLNAHRGLNRNLVVLGTLALLTLGGLGIWLAIRSGGNTHNLRQNVENQIINNQYFTQLLASGVTTKEDLHAMADIRPYADGFIGVSKAALKWEQALELARHTGAEILSVDTAQSGEARPLVEWFQKNFPIDSTLWVRQAGQTKLLDGREVLNATSLENARRAAFQWRLASKDAGGNTNELSAEEKSNGWKLLFDGKDAAANFRGYKMDKLPDGWVAENGELIRKKPAGDIVTKEQYESFELSLDWKISKGGNSGIMFKVQETRDASHETGPEAQVQDNKDGRDPQKAGWMYLLYAAKEDTTKPVEEWNHFVLKCQKTAAGTYKCEHWMNQVKYVEYEIGSNDWAGKVANSKFATFPDFGKAAKGHICLQDHGNEVAYKNIKIRELPELK